MKKKSCFSTISVIILLILSALALAGCGRETPVSQTSPGAEEEGTEPSGRGEETDPSGGEKPDEPSPAPFSHTVPGKAPDGDSADYVFPETAPFVDDTGSAMQRDGDCFYSYCPGNLIRFDTRSNEITLLYQTAPTHLLNFCLHGNDIYFVERTGCDSLDSKDTSLWRVGKNGKNLTLLQDDIVNADTFREWYSNYDIDIYDDIIYLLNHTSEYQDGEFIRKNASLYYRLNQDGTVSEAEESETLYGTLPRRFSPIFNNDFPSFPYAMRNYGYLFMQDSAGSLYRMDPVSGVRENLALDTKDGTRFCFSGDLIFLYSSYGENFSDQGKTSLLFHLADKTSVTIEELFSEQFSLSFSIMSPSEQGFNVYCWFREDNGSDTDTRHFQMLQIGTDGSVTPLTSVSQSVLDQYFSSEEYKNYHYLTAYSNDICILNGSLYCYSEDEAGWSLTRFSLQKGDALENLAAFSRFPAASAPSSIQTEEQNTETEIGGQGQRSFYLRKALLEEQTDADREINRVLSETYADFEGDVEELIREETEQMEEDPELYDGFDYAPRYDFSLSASCNYMDDTVISFCLDYYEYYAYAAHGYYWSDYYVFDRKTGKRLTCEDFVSNSIVFQNTARPYVEQVAGWEFDDEMLTDPSRFSLSEDGYTLYFAPYDIDCYAAGSFLITIPYEAFEKNL